MSGAEHIAATCALEPVSDRALEPVSDRAGTGTVGDRPEQGGLERIAAACALEPVSDRAGAGTVACALEPVSDRAGAGTVAFALKPVSDRAGAGTVAFALEPVSDRAGAGTVAFALEPVSDRAGAGTVAFALEPVSDRAGAGTVAFALEPVSDRAGAGTVGDRPEQRGLERIAAAFAAARAEGRAALMPYFTLGYPAPATSAAVVRAIAGAGADLIELGVPFSDPLADGPTIQRSTQTALSQGMTTARCLELVAGLRSAGVRQPLLLMGYVNPILAYGVARYVADAASAGVDGFIVPDLPPEEAAEMAAACRAHGCALVYLLAPTASPQRIATVAAATTGFLYLVALAGVTGARAALPADLAGFVERARRAAHTPVAVGFGISTPAQAAAVGRVADGVIVGSALIDAVAQAADPPQAAAEFVSGLRAALAVDG